MPVEPVVADSTSLVAWFFRFTVAPTITDPEGSVTIPVSPVSRASSDVTICVRIGRAREAVTVRGVESRPQNAAYEPGHEPSAGRVLVEYLRPGRASWWSLARSVARRMGLAHAPSGVAVALLALALVAAMTATTWWLMRRELA